MNFQKFNTSATAYAGMPAVQRQLQGAEQTKLFGDVFDDGSGQYPGLKPAGKPRTAQTGDAASFLPARVLLNYQIALQRDAVYAGASRGRLLLQGWQSHVFRYYEAGRQLEFAFL